MEKKKEGRLHSDEEESKGSTSAKGREKKKAKAFKGCTQLKMLP